MMGTHHLSLWNKAVVLYIVSYSHVYMPVIELHPLGEETTKVFCIIGAEIYIDKRGASFNQRPQ